MPAAAKEREDSETPKTKTTKPVQSYSEREFLVVHELYAKNATDLELEQDVKLLFQKTGHVALENKNRRGFVAARRLRRWLSLDKAAPLLMKYRFLR